MKKNLFLIIIMFVLLLTSCKNEGSGDKLVGKYYYHVGHTIDYDRYILFNKSNDKMYFRDSEGNSGECLDWNDYRIRYKIYDKEDTTPSFFDPFYDFTDPKEYICVAEIADGKMDWKKTFDNGNKISEKATYYLEGVIPEGTMFYLVFFDTLASSEIYSCHASVIESFPEVEHWPYIFDGWYFDSKYEVRAEIGMKLTKNTKLYSKWERPSE